MTQSTLDQLQQIVDGDRVAQALDRARQLQLSMRINSWQLHILDKDGVGVVFIVQSDLRDFPLAVECGDSPPCTYARLIASTIAAEFRMECKYPLEERSPGEWTVATVGPVGGWSLLDKIAKVLHAATADTEEATHAA